MQKIPFAENSYQLRSKPLSAQSCINFYPVPVSRKDAKTELALYGTPGLSLFCNLNQSAGVVGLHMMGDYVYAIVSNGDVFKIEASGVYTSLGSIGSTGDSVSMADNGTQLVVVKGSDGTGYVITSSAVAAITDPDYLLSSSVTYLDGYHIFTQLNSQVFFISELFNASSYDALDFSSAIRRADNLVAAQRVNDQIWLFGTLSTEVYYNSGAAAFPISQIPGGLIQKGCLAPNSIQAINTSVIWLGDDRVIYTGQGFTPTKISTPAIDFQIQKMQSPESAISFQYTQEGHIFYGITFPEESGATWVFDTIAGLWHQRQSNGLDWWRCRPVVAAFGKVLAGDYTNGKVYELDLDVYDEDGDPLIAEAVSAPIWADNKRFRMYNTYIDMEYGVGLNSGQGVDPQIMLQVSDDGGFNYTGEYWRSMGKIGEYTRRAVWKRLGQSRQRYLKIKISDPVKRVVMGCYADIEVDEA